MSVKVEKLEGNMAKLTIECSEERFEEALQKAYLKNKNQIQLQGFRKGKAPRAMIEKIYGAGVFYEDAANDLIPTAYDEALEEEEVKALDIVSQPDIEVQQIEKGKAFIFTADVAVRPEVKLGQYKDFDVEKEVAEVTDEDVDKELESVREQNSRTVTVEDRPIAAGDIAVIDYEGFCDGVAFDGGKGEDYELEIGSHSFIDTFEDQLVGKNAGDDVEVNVKFPEDYHAEELKGKDALFKVQIKSVKVKELPELDDEFAEEVSDFDTLQEYREDVKKKLVDRKQSELDLKRRDEIVEKAVANAEMTIPAAMIDTQARTMLNDYAQQMQMQGISMDMYMKFTNSTVESMLEEMKPQAETRIKNSLVLEAIADAEKIEITDEDVEEELKRMAESYKMELEEIKKYMNDTETENIKKQLAVQKAVEIITK